MNKQINERTNDWMVLYDQQQTLFNFQETISVYIDKFYKQALNKFTDWYEFSPYYDLSYTGTYSYFEGKHLFHIKYIKLLILSHLKQLTIQWYTNVPSC